MKNKGFRSFLNFLLLFGVTLVVLYFSLKDDYEVIIKQIFSMNIFWLLVAFIFMFLYWLLKAITVKKLVCNFNSSYSLKNAMRLVIETTFFHAITPFSSGGQPYEIYSLRKSRVRFTDATNVTIQNFIVYQIALVLLGIVSLITNHFCNLFTTNVILQKLVALGFVINTFVIIILFLLTFGHKLNRKIVDSVIHILYKFKIIKNKNKVLDRADSYLSEFHVGAKLLLNNKESFFSLILLQLISLCCLYIIPLFLLYGIGNYTAFTPFEAIVASAYVMLIGSFVPIPGGTGGLEYGFLTFYGNFIIGGSLRAIMIVWRFVTYYFGMLVGAIVLNIRKK